MDRRTTITVLVILMLVSIGYAVYRSTGQTITRIENGSEVVYGTPMHGLMLGLCIFAGACLMAIVMLLNKERDVRDTTPRERVTVKEEREALSKRSL